MTAGEIAFDVLSAAARIVVICWVWWKIFTLSSQVERQAGQIAAFTRQARYMRRKLKRLLPLIASPKPGEPRP